MRSTNEFGPVGSPDILRADGEPSGLTRAASAVRRDYFKNPFDGILTVAGIAAVGLFLYHALHWAVIDSVWQAKDGAECAQQGSGACWAVIRARFQLIVFGLYPHAELW